MACLIVLLVVNEQDSVCRVALDNKVQVVHLFWKVTASFIVFSVNDWKGWSLLI